MCPLVRQIHCLLDQECLKVASGDQSRSESGKIGLSFPFSHPFSHSPQPGDFMSLCAFCREMKGEIHYQWDDRRASSEGRIWHLSTEWKVPREAQGNHTRIRGSLPLMCPHRWCSAVKLSMRAAIETRGDPWGHGGPGRSQQTAESLLLDLAIGKSRPWRGRCVLWT